MSSIRGKRPLLVKRFGNGRTHALRVPNREPAEGLRRRLALLLLLFATWPSSCFGVLPPPPLPPPKP